MKRSILLTLAAGFTSLSSFGQFLVSWDTSGILGGVTPGPTTLSSNYNDPGISSVTMGVGAGLSAWAPTDSRRFQFTGFDTSTADSLSNDAYFQWTITPDSGQQFSLTSLDLGFRGRAGSATATDLEIYSSVDNYNSAVASIALPDGNSALSFTGITISGITNQASAVTFRMTLGTDSGGRPWAIYDADDTTAADFSLYGSVTAVPEPSTYALLAGILTLGLVFVRRRLQ